MPENSGKLGSNPMPERPWLWRWGVYSWLALGIVGAVIVIGLAYGRAREVVIPLIVAVILGVLLEPFVAFMTRHHIPRALATAITMLLIFLMIAGFIGLIAYSITTQAGAIGKQITNAVNQIKDWLEHLKVSKATSDWIHQQLNKAIPAIQNGLTSQFTKLIPGFASFLIGLFISFFILLFILSDDGSIYGWVAGHMGVPRDTGQMVLDNVFASFRGYFRGTTIIATVDALLIIPVLVILKVPLIPAIVLVTFFTCFIPSFGGYIGGAFAVLITLAARGIVPGLIVLGFAAIEHTIMQAPVQAIAYGKTLHLHPLVALLMTLLGAVFGGIFGAIIAVPITAVVLKVHREIEKVRLEGGNAEEPEAQPS